MISVVMMGCPDNKSSQNNNGVQTTTTVTTVQCSNCQNLVGGVFLTTESRDSSGYLTLKMQLAGSANAQQYGAYYSGQAATLAAELNVNQTMVYGSCQIPAGVYSLGTVEGGQYSQGILQNLRLMSSQNGIVLRLWNAQIASPNQRDGNGYLLPYQRLFSTNSYIESINGVQCWIPLTLN